GMVAGLVHSGRRKENCGGQVGSLCLLSDQWAYQFKRTYPRWNLKPTLIGVGILSLVSLNKNPLGVGLSHPLGAFQYTVLRNNFLVYDPLSASICIYLGYPYHVAIVKKYEKNLYSRFDFWGVNTFFRCVGSIYPGFGWFNISSSAPLEGVASLGDHFGRIYTLLFYRFGNS